MTDENKPLKVEFAPGCFDNFEGTQEELDEMIAEIQRMAESGELFDRSVQLSEEDFDELPDDVKAQLMDLGDDFEEGTELPSTRRTLQ